MKETKEKIVTKTAYEIGFAERHGEIPTNERYVEADLIIKKLEQFRNSLLSAENVCDTSAKGKFQSLIRSFNKVFQLSETEREEKNMNILSWILSGIVSVSLAILAFILTDSYWSMLPNIIYAIFAFIMAILSLRPDCKMPEVVIA
jgi:hypothetical protein